MKNKTVKVLLILLIIVMAVASFAACKKTPPPADPGGDGNTSQKEVADGAYIPGGINKISLNGEWDFYKDTRARAVTVAQDSGTLSKVALAAGETAVMKLFVDESGRNRIRQNFSRSRFRIRYCRCGRRSGLRVCETQ